MQYEAQVIAMQDNLAELDAVKIIIQIISEDKDDKVLDEVKLEVLHLGISMLLGGNPLVQEKFLEEMQSQKQNDFLIQIKKMIETNFQTVKRYMDHHNEWLQKQLLASVQKATI